MAYAHRAKVKDPAKAFISTWRTSIVYTGSTADNQIKLPLEVAGTYKFTVQWGDGTSNLITVWNQAETTHTYPAPGDYTVTITGYIKGWDFGQGGAAAPTTGDMRKLLTITQWGCLRFVTKLDPLPFQFWGAFYGCTNLNLTAVHDMPNFKGTVSTNGFLRGCTAITTINNINKWDVSKIQIFRSMLREMPLFDGNIGNWNTSNGKNFIATISGSYTIAPYGSFTNGGSDSIKNWDTSSATTMGSMLAYQIIFDHPVGDWDISNVVDISYMFNCSGGSVNGIFNNGGSDSIKNWNTGKVTNMQNTFFAQRLFNQEIGTWDVSKVTNMLATLMGPNVAPYGSFNNGGSDSIKNWDVSNVINMSTIFTAQKNFNQPIGSWNTSKVTDMSFLVYAYVPGVSAFNQDLSNWDTSKVTNMREMFRYNDNFNQPIGNWNVSLVTNFTNFMLGKTDLNYSAANYDALLIGWASRPVKPNLSINFGTIKRTAASTAARAILTSAPNNWTIVDGGI